MQELKPSSTVWFWLQKHGDSVLVSGEHTLMKTWLLTLYSCLSSKSCTLDLWIRLEKRKAEGQRNWGRLKNLNLTLNEDETKKIYMNNVFSLFSSSFRHFFLSTSSCTRATNSPPEVSHTVHYAGRLTVYFIYIIFCLEVWNVPISPEEGGEVCVCVGEVGRVTQVEVVERRWVEIRPCSFGHGGHKSC